LLHYLVDILESKVFQISTELNAVQFQWFLIIISFFSLLQFKDVLKLQEDLPHLKQASKVR
jgi:hypothetical protein